MGVAAVWLFGVPTGIRRPQSRKLSGVRDPRRAWLAVGLLGQACFSARFVVQWIVSERRGRSVVPESFWYLSLGGGATPLTYALYVGDPMFIMGQAFGLLIYVRNIWLSSPATRDRSRGAGLSARPGVTACPARTRISFDPLGECSYAQEQEHLEQDPKRGPTH